jgi:hypothetical protein
MAERDNNISFIRDKVEEVASTCHRIDKELAGHKVSFDQHIKQDELMYEEFRRMNDILQQNTESLKEHMHRSELLEGALMKMDARLSPLEIREIQRQAVKDWWVKNSLFVAKMLAAVGGGVTLVLLVKAGLLLLVK